MQDVLGRYIQNADQLDYDEEMDAAEEFGIADTDYGIVKRADSTPTMQFDRVIQVDSQLRRFFIWRKREYPLYALRSVRTSST